MIFLSKHLRYDTPKEVMDHMMKVFHDPVPFDKDIYIMNPKTHVLERRVEGDFYCGNINVKAK